MRRNLIVAFAIVAALLAVTSMPVAAQNASAVASEHTTFGTGNGSEPSPASLTNMSVKGSGDSAAVTLDEVTQSSTASPPDETVSTSSSVQRGFVINPNADVSEVSVTLGSITGAGTDAVDSVKILDSNENAIASKSGSFAPGDTVSFSVSLSAGTEYYIVADGSYRVGAYNEQVDFPYESSLVDVTSGWDASLSSGKTDIIFAFASVTASKTDPPDQAQYLGGTHDAAAVETGWTNITLSNASATLTWQEDADNDNVWANVTSTTVSSTANVTQNVSGIGSDRWRLRVDVTTTGASPVATIHDEGVLFDPASPALLDPEPPDQVKLKQAAGNVSINLSDPDFGLAQGDRVTVTATDDDGASLGSTNLTANGSASFSYAAENGQNVINWEAADEYGNTATFQQTFTTPSELIVKNESAPSQTVNNSGTITATFFGDSGETVVERSTTNGRFDLTGLPTDTTYIVQVDVNGFRSRQVVITSLFDQQRVYLLPDSAPAAQVQYVLDDKTGEFNARGTRLFIDAAIRRNGSTEFRTVFADEFGASGDLRVTLRDDTRYRIRVRNPGSGERVLGSYTASGADTVTLEIGQLSFNVPGRGEQSFNVSADTVTGANETVQAVSFSYNDPTGQTSRINVSVETLNGTVVGQAQATNAPYGSFSFTQPVNNSTAANATFTVKFEVTRAGETVSGQLRPGLNRYPPGVPLDDGLKQLFSVGFLLLVGGLFSATNARVGAVVTPLFAVGLWFVEWLPPGTSILAIALALGVGVLVNYGGRR